MLTPELAIHNVRGITVEHTTHSSDYPPFTVARVTVDTLNGEPIRLVLFLSEPLHTLQITNDRDAK